MTRLHRDVYLITSGKLSTSEIRKIEYHIVMVRFEPRTQTPEPPTVLLYTIMLLNLFMTSLRECEIFEC